MEQIVDAKAMLKNRNLLSILAESVSNPTEERLNIRADKYIMNPFIEAFVLKENDMYLGIIILDTEDNKRLVIKDIAVSSSSQKIGIGTSLINYCVNVFQPDVVIAETDDDAVGFYRKLGFDIVSLGDKYGAGIMRYQCTLKCKKSISWSAICKK